MWTSNSRVAKHLPRSGAIYLVALIAVVASPALAAVTLSEASAGRAAAVSGVAPILTQPSDMAVAAGATTDQEVHASDGDGNPITFLKSSGPEFMTVSTIDPGSGTALGNIRLAPGLAQAGATVATVSAFDGALSDSRSFGINVQPTPVAPVLIQPADMTVNTGETAIQELYASDANGDPLGFYLVSGPSYVSVNEIDPGAGSALGEIVVAPGSPVSGVAEATVGVSDGSLTDRRSLTITVNHVNSAPVLTPPAGMSVRVGEIKDQQLTAFDADGDPVIFSKVVGPAYMSVTTVDAVAGIGNVRLNPGSSDVGAQTGIVMVTDGVLTDQESLAIMVQTNVAPTFLYPLYSMTVRANTTADQYLYARDSDNDLLTFSKLAGPAYMTVTTIWPGPGGLPTADLQLAPGAGDAGTSSGTVRVSDGELFEEQTVSIEVLPPLGSESGSGAIYSNFGPGKAFDADPFHGWAINGGESAVANQFIPNATDTFESAEVALTLFFGTGGVDVFLQADSGGLPGPVLEQISLSGVTATPTVFKATSVLHPQLQVGTPYWLTIVARGAGVIAGWNWNSTGDTNNGTNFASTLGGSSAGPWGLDPHPGIPRSVFQINGPVRPIAATFALEPHTINLKSHGLNATGYIELPTGVDPSRIDYPTLRLAGSVPAAGPKVPVVGDHDGNGIPDLMVKFSRELLDPLLTPGTNRLVVTGALLSGERFEGADSVRVIDPRHQPLSAAVSPNPLNPLGVLTFETAQSGQVSIYLFDIQGRLVRRLLESKSVQEGSHEVLIDGRGEAGQPLASGVYFYRVEAPGGSVSGRFAVLK